MEYEAVVGHDSLEHHGHQWDQLEIQGCHRDQREIRGCHWDRRGYDARPTEVSIQFLLHIVMEYILLPRPQKDLETDRQLEQLHCSV